MASLPILYPPPLWSNQDIVLYHGTVDTYVSALTTGAVRVSLGKAGTDFGPGFYTTTVQRQARMGPPSFPPPDPEPRPPSLSSLSRGTPWLHWKHSPSHVGILMPMTSGV